MRPDLDDYEELNQENGNAPRGRAMSWLVLGVAVVGFGALAYYAYQSGSQTAGDGQMLVVEAEEGAIKETPLEAGGEQFPHKDKTIYDALSPYRTDTQKVEKLLPEPEEPVIPEPAIGSAPEEQKTEQATSSYVNENATQPAATEVIDSAPKPLEKEEIKDQPVATTTTPVTKPIVAAPVVKKETPAAPKPVVVAAPAKPVVAAPVKKVEPAKPAATGNYKIQLGAFKSEQEARQTWSKVTAKHGDVVKGSPIIVKADLANGTFYRLRAAGFSTADAAKKACTTLSARSQACFYVGQ